MRPVPALTAAALLTACAAPMEPLPSPPGPIADSGNDCAVIAAVAKEHFRFGPDNPPPPIRFEAGYAPRCDWSRHGLAFTPWDDGAIGAAATRWVSFDRPRYDGQGALIEVGIMHGPMAGQGSECRVRSGFAGWTATECRATWVS
jgi:hypothetical protein